jgi:hypothetical protein
MIEAQISGLAQNVGELRDGLNNVQNQLEAQGKALQGQINNVKSELQNELKQQKEKTDEELKKLDKKLKEATNENREKIEKEVKERKKALHQQKQELTEAINTVEEKLTQAQRELEKELRDFKQEVNERFEKQEQKIKENALKIAEEKYQREQEVKEVKTKINLARKETDNLKKEQEEITEQFQQKQHKLNAKLEETQQDLEDYQTETSQQIKIQAAKYQQSLEEAQEEFETKSKQVEAKLSDAQEILAEHEEELSQVQYQQKKQNILNQEIFENIQENNDILYSQQRKLNLVSQQMDDIQEEVHLRMDRISRETSQKAQETLNIAKDATKKVDRLTKDVQDMRDNLENIEEQIQKNKEDTEKIKQQAQQTNQRIDNILKTQSLMDFSQEQSNLDKIQKSLELKAEEAKLLATLNLLKETKNLVQFSANKEWLVGVKTGTETEVKGSEGMLLDPNSSWAKKYTKEQLQEWGWDTRLLGEHEKAQLLSEDQDQKEVQQEQVQSEEQKGEDTPISETTQQVLEEVNKVQTEILQKLSAIQEEIQQNISEVESTPTPTIPPKPSATTALDVIKAESKVKIKKKALERQKKEEENAKNRALTNPTKQNIKQVQEEQKETKKAEQELQQAQEELTSLEKKQDFEETLEQKEQELEASKSEQIKNQWQQIQELSQQALQKDQEKPEELTENTLNQKLEELVEKLQEQEVAEAASQKTMSRFMAFLIIFLLEYVVYKKNGLAGSVVLNIILLIAYNYREQLKKYADLWGKYLLIIGYIMGNVLAYSAPEQEKYKWPAVIGFNLTILAIYAYTWYQNKQEEWKREAFLLEQQQQLLQEANFTTEEQQKLTSDMNRLITENNNISTSQKAEHFSNLVQEKVLEKEQIAHKEAEVQKQAETLQKAQEMEQQLKDNLAQVQGNLAQPRITWNLIKQKYPEFTGEILFNELKKADNLIKNMEENQEAGTTARKSLLARLTKIAVPTNEEQALLAHLSLTLEQYIAISLKTPYLTLEEKDWITNNYLTLTQTAKLQLINSGLNDLEINTYEKKQKLVQLLINCHGEKELFGLTVKEKENILRFISNTLNLSEEQKEKLEEMGLRIYNASEWTVTDDQKDHLLDFGLNKLKLTEEQQENLAEIHPDQFRTFSLSGEQKNILNSLAPLIREDKYSNDSLQLLKSLSLKPTTQTFLVQEEIIPDPHLAFGTPKSFYLPLKEKFLKGEQKTLRKIKEIEDKKLSEEKLQENKLSILESLMEFANEREENRSLNLNFTLDNWVKMGVFREWQKDILLTLGFKTVPKYNYFELLIFAIKNFETEPLLENPEEEEARIQQEKYEIITQTLEILDTWKDKASGKEKEAIKKAIKQLSNETLSEEVQFNRINLLLNSYPSDNIKLNNLVKQWKKLREPTQLPGSLALYLENNPILKASYQEWINSLKNPTLTINKEIWKNYATTSRVSAKSDTQDLYELIDERVKSILGSFEPPKTDWEKWKDISSEFESWLVQDWKDQGFAYETTKEWINIGLSVNDANFAGWLRDEVKLTPEEVLNSNSEELRSQFAEYQKEQATKPEIIKPSTNKYDDLLAGLEGEERERQRKKLEREESRRQLEEAELSRRQSKLSEKDRKLKEQEERRQKEKELSELEEQKREEARIAREKALKEEQDAFLKSQQKQLEDKIKKSDENFANQRKEAELAEQKKKADLEELKRQNEFNQEKLAKDIEFLEEETQRKLEQIAHDDLKTRAEIEKKRKEEEIALRKRVAEEEQDLLSQQRKAEDEFNKLKENNRLSLQRAQQDLAVKKQKDAEELENLKKLGEQESQEAQAEIKRLKDKQAEEAKQAEETKKKQAEKEEITSREREKFEKLNNIWGFVEDLISSSWIYRHDYNESAIRYKGEKFTNIDYIDQWSTHSDSTTIKNLWERYPGIEINFAIIDRSSTHTWKYRNEETRRVYEKFINGILGENYWTEEDIKRKVKKITDVNYIDWEKWKKKNDELSQL